MSVGCVYAGVVSWNQYRLEPVVDASPGVRRDSGGWRQRAHFMQWIDLHQPDAPGGPPLSRVVTYSRFYGCDKRPSKHDRYVSSLGSSSHGYLLAMILCEPDVNNISHPINSVTILADPTESATRARKSHTKSRHGCVKCKARRVKVMLIDLRFRRASSLTVLRSAMKDVQLAEHVSSAEKRYEKSPIPALHQCFSLT
nr:hypothetical protein CFP56_20361 [Quercus suber]